MICQRTLVTLDTSERSADSGDIHEGTVAFVFEATLPEEPSFTASTSLQGPWLAQELSLWLPFKSAMFLLEAYHKTNHVPWSKPEPHQ
jgi:hypothetical protein